VTGRFGAGVLTAFAAADVPGRPLGEARFFVTFGARLGLVVFAVVELARFEGLCPLDVDELEVRALVGRAVLREAAARVPREVVDRVEPPPVARLRAGEGGRGVLRLAMTRPFLANLDSFPISNVSSIAYRDQ
jgi:hypothetical protein